jgi:hypothetical protein
MGHDMLQRLMISVTVYTDLTSLYTMSSCTVITKGNNSFHKLDTCVLQGTKHDCEMQLNDEHRL